MSDAIGITAGALLRAAREKQGMHIAALAAAIKVAPRKLDALEHDRYHELPDATFARALAQTVCRQLKIDPQPVLALLPQPETPALEHVGGSLNAPFRDRPSTEDRGVAAAAIRPMVWASAALMLGAVVLYLLPEELWRSSAPDTVVVAPAPAASVVVVSTPAASAAEAAAPSASAAVTAASAAASAVPAAPVVALAASQPASAAAPAEGMLQVQTNAASWVEVIDARGQVLISRTVAAGEAVALDGAQPLRVTIGNVAATQLVFRGQPVDLLAVGRNNVARFKLPLAP